MVIHQGHETAPDLLDRVRAMDEAATEYLDGATPENTVRSYASDWRTWKRYAAEVGVPVTQGSTGTLVGFVRWLSLRGAAPSTMRRRLVGAVATLRDEGHQVDREAVKAARKAVRAEERRLAEAHEKRGRGKAPALVIEHIRLISAKCPDTLDGWRDRAAVLLGFAIAARRAELAALQVFDITEHPEGLEVDVRCSKTAPRVVVVPYGAHLATCPVRTWRKWLEVSGITDGPAIRRVDRHGRLLGGLRPDGVGAIVARAAARAGLDARTAHGLRSGMATSARKAGRDAVSIGAQGGWAKGSKELFGYMQIVDRWDDNALNNIGL